MLDTCAECECVLVQGEAKEEMMLAMGLNTEEEGSAMAFLRRGYKVQPRPACGPPSDLSIVVSAVTGIIACIRFA